MRLAPVLCRSAGYLSRDRGRRWVSRCAVGISRWYLRCGSITDRSRARCVGNDGALGPGAESTGRRTIGLFESFALHCGQSLGMGKLAASAGARGERDRGTARTSDTLAPNQPRRGREPTPPLGETVYQKATERFLSLLRRPVVYTVVTAPDERLIDLTFDFESGSWAVGTEKNQLFPQTQELQTGCACTIKNCGNGDPRLAVSQSEGVLYDLDNWPIRLIGCRHFTTRTQPSTLQTHTVRPEPSRSRSMHPMPYPRTRLPRSRVPRTVVLRTATSLRDGNARTRQVFPESRGCRTRS